MLEAEQKEPRNYKIVFGMHLFASHMGERWYGKLQVPPSRKPWSRLAVVAPVTHRRCSQPDNHHWVWYLVLQLYIVYYHIIVIFFLDSHFYQCHPLRSVIGSVGYHDVLPMPYA